ncbi:MAG: hypothetical protein WCJ21_09630, partial [Planctomycetota bacterium]
MAGSLGETLAEHASKRRGFSNESARFSTAWPNGVPVEPTPEEMATGEPQPWPHFSLERCWGGGGVTAAAVTAACGTANPSD